MAARLENLARREAIASGAGSPWNESPPGVEMRPLVGDRQGARGVSTFTARFSGDGIQSLHSHDCGEAITVLEGCGIVAVGEEEVRLEALDCIFLPAGQSHAVQSASSRPLLVHSAFASAEPKWSYTANAMSAAPEKPSANYFVRRVRGASGYDLGGGTEFHDLFAGRFGSSGICGGWARFQPGSSLPCHLHEYDESITIVEGRAVCLVEGRRYELNGCDTALVPKGMRHRFLNLSDAPMAMIWVYAGDEPSRTIVDAACCGAEA